ncbi:helix-turn-helix transcriptional regulator [Pseudohalocynthiibacter aestuariivivens]|uniref:Helix-turn-helix transcriptional regulator n=1 Tax=Roseovarius pelagicus TaxID=2980108 RepID=A0ABY6DJS6_9RHOB|nr:MULTISPECIES: helix-turn-helix domain-containing protein [Rhodobacterales]QIE44081.1 helix-turn-helix transcriptional regulator [Pseudohalocynthiibacter aestuariivivens]UXX84020.1 helix-turn-helix transcriptional regulator [Roseovarius pelagicus]
MGKSENEQRAQAHAIEVVGDKWTLLLVSTLMRNGPSRFLDLQDSLGVSPNTLSARLKRMEGAGLIARHPYSENPPRSAYKLTPSGSALLPVLDAMKLWALQHGVPRKT